MIRGFGSFGADTTTTAAPSPTIPTIPLPTGVPTQVPAGSCELVPGCVSSQDCQQQLAAAVNVHNPKIWTHYIVPAAIGGIVVGVLFSKIL